MKETQIRRQIMEYLAEYHALMRHWPQAQEIRAMFAGSTGEIELHLEQLQREGLVNCGSTGTVEIPPTIWHAPGVRISGAPGGGSIFFDLTAVGIDNESDLYGFVVSDDCMIDAGIRRGDIAIITPRATGDIFVVWNSGKMTLRRLVSIHGLNYFLAENSLRPDLWLCGDNDVAYGSLWGIVRTEPVARNRPPRIGYSALAKSPKPQKGIKWPPRFETARKKRAGASAGRHSHQTLPVVNTAGRKHVATKLKVKFPKPPPRIGLNDAATTAYQSPQKNSPGHSSDAASDGNSAGVKR